MILNKDDEIRPENYSQMIKRCQNNLNAIKFWEKEILNVFCFGQSLV